MTRLWHFLVGVFLNIALCVTPSSGDDLRQLSVDSAWLALLHTHPGALFFDFKSEIDSDAFFLSPSGKYDPYKEIVQNVETFFQEPLNTEHICKFPARYEFLRERLRKEVATVEELCPEVLNERRWRDAKGVSLVFAESFLRNPASMFGHTFLRFERRDLKHSRLLDDTLTFAASSGGQGGLSLVFNGLTGGYAGAFKSAPYYIRVKQYSDIDRRDLREYRATLTEDELRFLQLHMIELKHAAIDYYFFDENCSYHLLSLFRILRPHEPLLQSKPPYVIPIDTVRVLKRLGLIEKVPVYRPSLSSELQMMSDLLTVEEAELVEDISAGEFQHVSEQPYSSLAPDRQALVLSAADTLLRFHEADGQEGTVLKRKKIADERSLIGRVRSPASLVSDKKGDPLDGHLSSAVRATTGTILYRGDLREFLSLGGRPALHALSDPAPGYQREAELEFLEPELRWYGDGGTLSLEKLKLFRLQAMPATMKLYQPYSWKMSSELRRFRFESEERKLVFTPSFAVGRSYRVTTALRASLLLSGDSYFSSHFDDGVELAPGVIGQLQWSGGQRWQWLIEGGASYAPLDLQSWLSTFSAKQGYSINKQLAQRLTIRSSEEGARDRDYEFMLNLDYFFSSF